MPSYTINLKKDGITQAKKNSDTHIIAEVFCDGDTTYLESVEVEVDLSEDVSEFVEMTAAYDKKASLSNVKERLFEIAEEIYSGDHLIRGKDFEFDRWQDR